MSRSLEGDVKALERKARHKAAAIRRVVHEYNQSLDAAHDDQAGPVVSKQREMEREIAEYLKLYKSIKRARKRLQTKAA
ncbi:MAG TPA: hypothetical protein VJZ91_09485 [Blastocatellia bacterium]|nr:hypothetical protein [Blastocatellia bacterium]